MSRTDRATVAISTIAAITIAAGALAFSAPAFAGVAAVERYNGHDYAFMDHSATFDQAQEDCEDLGMDLVTLNSYAEQDWLIERTFLSTPDNAHAGYLNNWIWIGAYNDDVDGDMDVYDAMNDEGWQWISGQRFRGSDFDGSMDLGAWNYDNHGAAVTITGPYTTGPFGTGHEWRISPADYYRAFVCESRRPQLRRL